ncbi:MAG TPA: alpha/beta hydrolase [Allosphingosinicella sp.]|jgi:esterase/lipase superfamily enzyme
MVRTGRFSFFLLLLVAAMARPAAARDCDRGGPRPARYAIPVFYVTDRNDLDPGPGVRWGRESDVLPHYGLAATSITRSCATLPATAPFWWQPYVAPPGATRSNDYFQIHDDAPFADEAAMMAGMRAALDGFHQSGGSRDVILFLHGYNQDFREAGRDGAQLALDLPFRGVPVFYSWPSQDSLFRYDWDAIRIERAFPQIRTLIARIIDELHPDHFHIVAHSMGNRAAIDALVDLAHDRTDLNERVTSLTMLSPDVDRIVFQRLTKGELGRIAGRIALFVNRRDRALWVSGRHYGGARLGRPGDDPFVAPEVTSIDISRVSPSITHHADFEHQAAIMREIEATISGVPIRQRPCLEQVATAEGPYYRIDPSRAGCPAAGAYPPSD